MITVEEAKQIIEEQVKLLPPVQLLLSQSAGLVLAGDTYAVIDMPPFAQSSMDGYAFLFSEWQLHKKLPIAGEIAAGSDKTMILLPKQAVRIFTGAPLPEGADTVVMQERTTIINGELILADEHLSAGINVRPRGTEIKAGAQALKTGTVLSPAAIGFLAGIGVTQVQVYPKPKISIIVTGKELQQPGNPLQYGQVYESNSATLTAALQQLNIRDVKIYSADDDPDILKEVLQTAMEEADVILLTGGISVGDYDFVLEAALQCGISKLFHRIKQRPGKPLYFGHKISQLVFGLPGNPSSVLTCFYEYVLPALQKLSNNKNDGLKTLQVTLSKKIDKPAGLTQFLKGYYDGEKVLSLDAQESYRLSSFARANCLIKLEEKTTHCAAGTKVEIHLLPDN